MSYELSTSVAKESGIAPAQAQAAFLTAILGLHRHAVTNSHGLTGAITESYCAFRPEALCHLAMLLDLQRRAGAPDLPWSETLARLGHDILEHADEVGHWLAAAALAEADLPPLSEDRVDYPG